MKKEEIQSFEDACKVLGIEPALPIVDSLPEKHAKAIVANYKLFVIAQALNEGWEPDWNDFDQYKYYPWFDMEQYKDESGAVVGSGFSFNDYVYVISYTLVGSRLCFKSADLARYAGKQFEALYRDVFVIDK